MDKYKLSLLRGSTIEIHGMYIKPLTLGEIEEMGIDKYYGLLNLCTLNKRDCFKEMSKEDLDKISIFDVLTINKDMRHIFIEFLNQFILHDSGRSVEYVEKMHEIIVVYKDDISRINGRNIGEILDLIRKMYCIDKSATTEEKKYKNKEAELAFKEFEEWEDTLPKPKTAITLCSVIVGLIARRRFTFDEIWNKTIYQVMQVFNGVNKEDNYILTMGGVYSGTVDTKQINLEELNWAIETDI